MTRPFRSALFTAALVSGAAALMPVTASAQLPPLVNETYVTGVSSPVGFVQDPSDPTVQFVVQQGGLIRVIKDGSLLATPFINLTTRISSGSERGLLGLAFPPDYAKTGRFYVNYTNTAGHTHVARYQRNASNPLLGDFNSEEVILLVAQPFSNHNAGNLAFGPDGYLYIGLGDGGSGGDPGHRSQNPNMLLGKMLRLDVSTASGYAIPQDNPFVDGQPIAALHEIWSFGLRNPWRYSFDDPNLGGTGALIIADVGQNAWEEVNYEPAGAGGRNYGWRNREGLANFNNDLAPAYTPLTNPIHVYGHAVGRSISGGYVYRGTKLGAAYRGRYFFADYVNRRVWSMGLSINGQGEASVTDVFEHTAQLGGSANIGNITAFGVDSEGELYLCSTLGRIIRLAPSTSTSLTAFQVNSGTLMAGNLNSLTASDDNVLDVRSQFGFTALEPNLTEIVVNAQTTVANPIQVNLTVEERITQNGGSLRLWLFNYNTDLWVLLGQAPSGSTETIHTHQINDDPARFRRASDGLMRVRARHVVLATFTALGFRSLTDQVKFDVY